MISAEQEKESPIARVRIELKGSNPLIWRLVEVPISITLNVLHDVVQAAMGWEDRHAWEFLVEGRAFGPPGNDDRGETLRGASYRAHLIDFLSPGTVVLDYIYNLRDSWRHRLIVSDIRLGRPEFAYPRFIAGGGCCPPDDCGGPSGLTAVEDGQLQVRPLEGRQWHGSASAEIDVVAIRAALKRIAMRREGQVGRDRKPLDEGRL